LKKTEIKFASNSTYKNQSPAYQRSLGFFIATVFSTKLLKCAIVKRFLKVKIMITSQQLYQQAHQLPALEKLRLAELLLSDLDLPDSLCDKAWAKEAQQRWQAYQEGKLTTVSYDAVMAKYQ